MLYINLHRGRKLTSKRVHWADKLGGNHLEYWMNPRGDGLRLTAIGYNAFVAAKFSLVELPVGKIELWHLLVLDRYMDCPYYLAHGVIHLPVGMRAFDIKMCGSLLDFILKRLLAGKGDVREKRSISNRRI